MARQRVSATLALDLAGAEIERIWATSLGRPLTDEQAAALAYSELRAARKANRAADR